MHWGAMVDGNDVEFILGSSPVKSRSVPPEEADAMTSRELCEATNFEFNHRAMELWLKAGIDKLVKAFIFNDPYYPRPNQSELRTVFREAYLNVIHRLTESFSPEAFIARVEMESKQKKSIDNLF
ncbi:hypothetical protein LY76DRAFT_642928 [Colletotrichum caudatum]|nr:hypothetical protein LY76DRAFT_642928 [Colletotrichum caudatum]